MESDAGKDGSRKRMYRKCYDKERLKNMWTKESRT